MTEQSYRTVQFAKEVVERAYPPEDVAGIKNFQKEIWKSL